MLYTEEELTGLKECFTENFSVWLLSSNCPKPNTINKSLSDILDVILKEPEADYFWYSHNNELTWATPEQEEVHSQSIRLNKDKLKNFLRDIKLNTILNEN